MGVTMGVNGTLLFCAPGDEENLEERLDSQEFRREVPDPGDAVGDFDKLAFVGCNLSVEPRLVKPGLCGICLGADPASFVGCGEPVGV
jgi:hypothetical protein